MGDLLADGPLPASQVKEEAEGADISESTLKRAKKVVGVITYRENEAGEKRGAGRWMWKLPVVELVEEEVQGDHSTVQGDQGAPKENPDPLEHKKGAETREFGLGKGNVQEGQGLPSRGPSVQGDQGSNFAEDDPLERCNHGYSDGKGCYLCDSDHPYRTKEGAT